MRLTDDDLKFLYHELSSWYEAALCDSDAETNQTERLRMLERLMDKVGDEQIRRQGKREALPGKKYPSKWDRFVPGSAVHALMEKINRDRQR